MTPTYWLRACAALSRNVVSTPGFARRLAITGLVHDTSPRAPTKFLLDAYPEAEGVAVQPGTVSYRRSNLDPMEQFVLLVLCQLRQPQRIFEFGTYDGATSLQLARGAPEAEVVTLDLPDEQADTATVASEAENARYGVGSRFRGTQEATRITQLLGDSRVFDFTPWYGTADLVLVDAGHDYDCARSDTANAFKLLAPGGLIVWDDYTRGWPGVVQAVDEASASLGRSIVHIASTDFAVYDDRSPAHP